MSDLAHLVADPLVELFALQTQEVISRLQNATFGGDGSGSVDVVSCYHADSDTGPLALPDGFWYLTGTTKKAQQRVKPMNLHGQTELNNLCPPKKKTSKTALNFCVFCGCDVPQV